jgi:DNA-binding NtrC family response regulator
MIMPEHLPPKISSLSASETTNQDRQRLSQVERATILATLEECQGNRTRAAEKLGISRRALLYKLRSMPGNQEE